MPFLPRPAMCPSRGGLAPTTLMDGPTPCPGGDRCLPCQGPGSALENALPIGQMPSFVGAVAPCWNEAALAQLSAVKNIPPDAVKINANENPLGPAPGALEAIARVLADGGRYSYNLTDEFCEVASRSVSADDGEQSTDRQQKGKSEAKHKGKKGKQNRGKRGR